MAHAGQELNGPNGFRLLLLDLGGDVLEMEAHYAGRGDLPPEHYHPHQLETFEVLDGAVRAVVHGVEHRYPAGEAFEIPAGTPHQMAGDGPARVRWRVEPPLRTAEFFERLYELVADPSRSAEYPALFEEFSDEVVFTS